MHRKRDAVEQCQKKFRNILMRRLVVWLFELETSKTYESKASD